MKYFTASLNCVRRVYMTLLVIMIAMTSWAQHQSLGNLIFPVADEGVNDTDGILFQGWAYDPDAPTEAISVWIEFYTEQECQNLVKSVNCEANETPFWDIPELKDVEGNHLFEEYIKGLTEGTTYWVKLFAIDITGDGEVQVGLTKEMTVVKPYHLSLGDVEVTPSNRDDILGDGKARYDIKTHTLTLNDPIIPLYGSLYGILATNMDLTIKGSWHMTDAVNDYMGGIFVEGNLTLDGSFTFKSGKYGNGISSDTLTIASGTIVATGGFLGITCSDLIVCNGVKKIEAQALDDNCAIYGKISKPDGGYGFPEGYGFIDPAGMTVDEFGEVQYEGGNCSLIVIGRNTSYGIYLGSTMVTPSNKDDILSDGGSAQYDPETFTLTLNEPEVTNYYFYHDNYEGYCNLYIVGNDVTITGSWYMDNDANRKYGIIIDNSNVTLDGAFKFVGSEDGILLLNNTNVTLNGEIGVFGENNGINISSGSKETLTISSGILKATGSNVAIAAYNLIIESGVTKVELNSTNDALRYENLVLGEGISITAPMDGLPHAHTLYNLDGEILNSAVIEPSDHPIPQVSCELVNLGWFGNNRICSWNVSDKTDGKVTFDYENNTLTFDNPTIIGVHDNAKIFLNALISLTLKGSYHMTEAETEYGLYNSSDLTLDGDFTFYGSTSGINNEYSFSIIGGKINAIGQTYGIKGSVTLGLSDIDDYIYSSSFHSIVYIADGQTLYDGLGNAYSGNYVNIAPGRTLRSYDYRLFLSDNTDNSETIQTLNGRHYNVTLQGRTLYRNGDWNTLCLPFGVKDGDDSDDISFTGTPLEGATVKELKATSNLTGSILTLDFEDVASIVSGRPYILKWNSNPGGNIVDPVFENVTIDKTPSPIISDDGNVTFMGSYAPYADTEGLMFDEHNTGNRAFEAALQIMEPAPRDGYTYGGRFTDAGFNTPATVIPLGDDGNSVTTLYDKWTRNTVALTALNSGSSVEELENNWAGKTVDVSFTRSFTQDVASTICLPYPMTSIPDGGSVYEFVDVQKEAGVWVATMSDATPDGNKVEATVAGKPYLFMPLATGEVTFTGTVVVPENVTAGTSTSDANDGTWTFRGTYSRLAYKSDGTADLDGSVFGFASATKEVDGNMVNAGEFVKAKDGAGVPAFRAYLTYDGTNNAFRAPARGSDGDEELEIPDRITVRLLGMDGTLTAVGTMDTVTGEVKVEQWFDMLGRPVDGTPALPGMYINNNGSKMLIK